MGRFNSYFADFMKSINFLRHVYKKNRFSMPVKHVENVIFLRDYKSKSVHMHSWIHSQLIVRR